MNYFCRPKGRFFSKLLLIIIATSILVISNYNIIQQSSHSYVIIANNIKYSKNKWQDLVIREISTHRDISYLSSTQEEADTKIILHVLDAKDVGASTLEVHSLDTDVLVLLVQSTTC